MTATGSRCRLTTVLNISFAPILPWYALSSQLMYAMSESVKSLTVLGVVKVMAPSSVTFYRDIS